MIEAFSRKPYKSGLGRFPQGHQRLPVSRRTRFHPGDPAEPSAPLRPWQSRHPYANINTDPAEWLWMTLTPMPN